MTELTQLWPGQMTELSQLWSGQMTELSQLWSGRMTEPPSSGQVKWQSHPALVRSNDRATQLWSGKIKFKIKQQNKHTQIQHGTQKEKSSLHIWERGSAEQEKEDANKHSNEINNKQPWKQ